MLNKCKLLVACRIVIRPNRAIVYGTRQGITPLLIKVPSSASIMAQRSITSFFKVSPPKSAVKVEEHDVGTKVKIEDQSNGNSKTSSKRPRIDSSGSETPSPTKVSPVSSEKKKKAKRQRIESSGSESEPSAAVETITIKVEPIDIPKKDASPKSDVENKSPSQKQKNSLTNRDVKTGSPKKSKKKTPTQGKIKEKSDISVLNGGSKKCSSPKNVNKDSSVCKIKKEPEDRISESTNSSSLNKTSSEEKSPKAKVLTVKHEKDEKSAVKAKVPGVEYNPAKVKYHPIDDACWSKGEEVPYLALAKTLEAIEATSARLKIIEILSNYFRSVIALTPDDLLPSVYMCLNQLAPAYHSLELGIAETYLMKAIGQCTGRTLSQVRSAAAQCGDLGQVAQKARSAQRTMFAPPPLTTRRVFAGLQQIARISGQASVNKKIDKIQSLYVACKHSEARYLIRSLEGKLRIGLAEQSVLQALALATAMTPPAADGHLILDASRGLAPDEFKAVVDRNALTIKTTYCECPNYDELIPVLLRHGVAALPQHCRLAPGVPLKPMLAHPTKGVSEIFDRFEKEKFTCEWKYDGERAQIHVPGDVTADFARAAVFSRNQENNTTKYPDILRRLPALLKQSVTSCVLDCEAVAYDTATKQILPFQVLSTRKRKDAAEDEIKVQVCVFVFDLLYFNGEPLVRRPLQHRRDLLREHFNVVEGEWQFATSKDCTSVEEVQQFLDEAIRGSCEGLMVKTLTGDNARYDIARRSHNWLKLKKDYLDGAGDSIDAAVLGGFRGRGRRAGLLGGFLLACRDAAADEYQSLCKIGTGFADEDLAALTAALQEHVIDAPRSYYRFDPSHTPDVWFSAACVWEIRCADLSLSPVHRAAIGLVDPDKGISLRFPRFIRVRPDKSPEQATSAQQIADMYLAQDQVKNTAGVRTNHDDFY